MEKSTAKSGLELAAKDLKINGDKPWKNQAAHLLFVARELCNAAEIEDAEVRKKVYVALKGVGHGFACNASQFAQWVEKEESSGATVDIAKELEV